MVEMSGKSTEIQIKANGVVERKPAWERKEGGGGKKNRRLLFRSSCVWALSGPYRPLACGAYNNRHEGGLQATRANGFFGAAR